MTQYFVLGEGDTVEGSEANTRRFRHRLAGLAGGPLRARADLPGREELLEAGGCGMLLTDDSGSLNPVSASTEPARLPQQPQRCRSGGSCVVSFHTGRGTQCPNSAHGHTWWPSFSPAAQDAGDRAVQTSAMRLWGETIGTTGGPSGTEPRAAPAGQGCGDPFGLPPGRRRRGPRTDPFQERFDA